MFLHSHISICFIQYSLEDQTAGQGLDWSTQAGSQGKLVDPQRVVVEGHPRCIVPCVPVGRTDTPAAGRDVQLTRAPTYGHHHELCSVHQHLPQCQSFQCKFWDTPASLCPYIIIVIWISFYIYIYIYCITIIFHS